MSERPETTDISAGVQEPQHEGATKSTDPTSVEVPEQTEEPTSSTSSVASEPEPKNSPDKESPDKENKAKAKEGSVKKGLLKQSDTVTATPTPLAQPKATGGFRARRVHRVVLRVDPWSVLKLSLVFLFCFWLMMVIAIVLMWGAAVSSGTITNLEDFVATLLSFEEFKLNGNQILRFIAMLGLILVFVGTALSAIVAVLFNLVTSVIGGVRVTVIEEESMRRIIRE